MCIDKKEVRRCPITMMFDLFPYWLVKVVKRTSGKMSKVRFLTPFLFKSRIRERGTYVPPSRSDKSGRSTLQVCATSMSSWMSVMRDDAVVTVSMDGG